jgi:uncharacterized protein YdaU (DUF1376 family)
MTAESLAMMPWFADAYIAATRHMTLAERGAYFDLLCFQWTIGPLPTDKARLAKLISVSPKEFSRVWPAIKGKFKEARNGFINERLEQHRQKATRLRAQHREGARKTNHRRWGSHGASLSDSVSESPSDGNGVAERIASNSNSNSLDAYQGGRVT